MYDLYDYFIAKLCGCEKHNDWESFRKVINVNYFSLKRCLFLWTNQEKIVNFTENFYYVWNVTCFFLFLVFYIILAQ